jgi:pyruvate dehydrogenase E2 component (dihydrolipoyllysine-residue acetyltransferase)
MAEKIQPITMPKWGMAMEEGTVVVWHVEEGAPVAAGQEVVDVESPKIANAIEAKQAGLLRRKVAAIGEVLPVGALLGVIADREVPDAEVEAFVEGYVRPEPDAGEAAGPAVAAIEAGGRRFAYVDQGAGEPPILLLHGFGGDHSSWMFNQAPLAESRRAIALDLPGHGGSDKDVGDGSVAALAGAVEDAIGALGLARYHLAGHSLGGAVAMAIAAKHPERVASLVLVASAGLGPEIDGRFIDVFTAAERRKEMVAVAEALFADRKLVTRKLVEDMLRMKRIDGVTEAMRRIAAREFPGGRQTSAGAAARAALEAPVLVIWGGKDRVIPVAHARALPGARVELLPEAGHMVHAESYAEVNRLIAEFCAAHR